MQLLPHPDSRPSSIAGFDSLPYVPSMYFFCHGEVYIRLGLLEYAGIHEYCCYVPWLVDPAWSPVMNESRSMVSRGC